MCPTWPPPSSSFLNSTAQVLDNDFPNSSTISSISVPRHPHPDTPHPFFRRFSSSCVPLSRTALICVFLFRRTGPRCMSKYAMYFPSSVSRALAPLGIAGGARDSQGPLRSFPPWSGARRRRGFPPSYPEAVLIWTEKGTEKVKKYRKTRVRDQRKTKRNPKIDLLLVPPLRSLFAHAPLSRSVHFTIGYLSYLSFPTRDLTDVCNTCM